MSPPQPPQSSTPFYLEMDAGPVFAFFHPGSGAPRARAVLLCPPFGWDDMCSYRSRRDWAERLALGGYPTLRLDLPGSGDSAGGPSDSGQLTAWTRALAGAAQWLLESTPATQVTAVGIGLGGLLAFRACAESASIAELVLWNVPSRGRALVRELRAFSAMEVAYIPDPSSPDDAEIEHRRPPDGAVVANGYLLGAETVGELERLDLAALELPSPGPRRALLLERDGLKVDERLREALERAHAAVTVADGAGYGAMMIEPQDARPPTAVFALLDSWLGEGEAEACGAQPAATGERRDSMATAAPIATRQDVQLTCDGVEVRETPVYMHGPDGLMFGILTEPLGERRELCAVLMNAGPQRRTGPNRMWVETARRWAARGVPTLRFDLTGMGDSDGDAASLVHVASLYSRAYVGQARAALDMLSERGLPDRFLLIGLCAGAYWSTHAALEDERIAAVVMLNPRTLIWDAWVYGVRRTRELRKQLLMASTWRKALRGQLTLARHLETARSLASRSRSRPRRFRERFAGPASRADRGEAMSEIFDRLRDRDQRVLMVFTGSEPLHRELTAMGVLEDVERWSNLRLVVRGTSADTHTLTPLWLQHQVHELIDEALERELERAAAVEGKAA